MSRAPSPLRGAVDVAAAALAVGVRTVADVHRAIARKPFAALRLAPGVGTASKPVRLVHDGVTGLVYAGLSGGVALFAGAARLAAAVAPAPAEPRAASAAGLAVAALNGFAGDRLARDGNPLTTAMGLRHHGRPLPPRREALAAAFPAAAPRLAVFVHGLACNEALWWRHAERHYGDAGVSYGTRLERELGFTALYVRYNSGLPIAANGRALAELLDAVVAEWPVPVEELVLVGHSMGGLVLRSAMHHAAADTAWVARLRHAFYLGSPHRGAPLEKAANVAAWLLGWSDVTRPLAAAVNRRSRGIKDLRFGALRDEDWQGADVDALLDDRTEDLPLPPGANHHFIAATLSRDRHHPLAVAVGDLLVRPASALGRRRHTRVPLAHPRHLGAMTHLALLNHPAVYDQIHRALRPSAG
jgi:hypothetical protein